MLLNWLYSWVNAAVDESFQAILSLYFSKLWSFFKEEFISDLSKDVFTGDSSVGLIVDEDIRSWCPLYMSLLFGCLCWYLPLFMTWYPYGLLDITIPFLSFVYFIQFIYCINWLSWSSYSVSLNVCTLLIL